MDHSLIAHVAFIAYGTTFNIPMTFARIGDSMFFHSSKLWRFHSDLQSGTAVCVGATNRDGIVLAKSAFNISMDYQSVAAFGSMKDVVDYDMNYPEFQQRKWCQRDGITADIHQSQK